jgi:polyisoprenoid-binding protein YceI
MSWQIDPSHSQIEFSVRHMMISNVRGRFEEFSGTVEFDEENPEATRIEVKIDAASINTRDEKRDAHLKSDDFLNAEEYPYLTYVSRSVEKVGDKRFRVIGDLTIRDVTREVPLDVEYQGLAKSPWGTVSVGFSAHAKVDRTKWGLTWNAALETGGILVGNDVKIDIELELVQQEEEVEA